MFKLKLVVFSNTVNLKKITDAFDKEAMIDFWFFDLPNSVFVKTSLTPTQLSQLIDKEVGVFTHVVVEVEKYWGRLPSDHWKYFK